ncbi:ATP-binding cassette domain-containing protein [Streptomyces sp. NPDC012450]|uniref:ABC transporter ATP-binding protein n=1 Tax=Streptomyces sp. NPDC012450 TaxID=3364834 RepID=UPI0036E37792
MKQREQEKRNPDGGDAIVLRGVTRAYGAVRAADGLDLTVRRGETVALLGRNGAGKSTAIGLLLGLDEPDEGRVELFGGPPGRAVAAGRVGAMLQEGRPVSRVTVRELVGFVARTYPAPMPVAEALALAGLTALAGRRLDRLSGGQVQRVRFAVALAGNPELIVLDEPTAALDVEARQEFWDAMRGYARRGNTVLFSTHYLEEADAYADRIVVLDSGRIAADGTSAQLKRAAGGSLVSFDLGGGPAGPLDSLPGVTSYEIRGDRVRLRTTDSDATVRALAERDAIRGLEVVQASLNDTFLALTRRPPAAAGPVTAPLETTR